MFLVLGVYNFANVRTVADSRITNCSIDKATFSSSQHTFLKELMNASLSIFVYGVLHKKGNLFLLFVYILFQTPETDMFIF